MPILEYTPPTPATRTPLSPSRSSNIALAASPAATPPQARKIASSNSARLPSTPTAPPLALADQDDVSMELALSQETQARLDLRSGGSGGGDAAGRPDGRDEQIDAVPVGDGEAEQMGDEGGASRRSSVGSDDLPPLHGALVFLCVSEPARRKLTQGPRSQSRSASSRRRRCGTT